MIEDNHIELRDFMVLSFVCDQNELSINQLISALGLSRQSVVSCAVRLREAGLVIMRQSSSENCESERVSPTAQGRTLARRILEN